MANTIIFLGAGASKADGAPLQAELFKSYVHSLIGQTNLGPQNRCQKNKQNILTYFKNFFGFIFVILADKLKNILLWFMLDIVLPMFSSMSFAVSGLTFRSLIHFELIFVYRMEQNQL